MNGKEQVKTLAALFDRDHTRLMRMLEDVAYLCRKASYVPAAKVYGEFRRLMDHHLFAEERALAALVEQGFCPESVASRIASDHVQLRELIEDTWQAITRNDVGALDRTMSNLSRSIAAHERAEQEEVLPALCACLADPAKIDRAVRQLIDP